VKSKLLEKSGSQSALQTITINSKPIQMQNTLKDRDLKDIKDKTKSSQSLKSKSDLLSKSRDNKPINTNRSASSSITSNRTNTKSVDKNKPVPNANKKSKGNKPVNLLDNDDEDDDQNPDELFKKFEQDANAKLLSDKQAKSNNLTSPNKKKDTTRSITSSIAENEDSNDVYSENKILNFIDKIHDLDELDQSHNKEDNSELKNDKSTNLMQKDNKTREEVVEDAPKNITAVDAPSKRVSNLVNMLRNKKKEDNPTPNNSDSLLNSTSNKSNNSIKELDTIPEVDKEKDVSNNQTPTNTNSKTNQKELNSKILDKIRNMKNNANKKEQLPKVDPSDLKKIDSLIQPDA